MLYIILYGGYTIYERCVLGNNQHLVPLLQVDLDTDAVWKRGDGIQFRERDALEQRSQGEVESGKPRWRSLLANFASYVY